MSLAFACRFSCELTCNLVVVSAYKTHAIEIMSRFCLGDERGCFTNPTNLKSDIGLNMRWKNVVMLIFPLGRDGIAS
jgi:hypothetical protein